MHTRACEHTRIHWYMHVVDGIEGASKTCFQRNQLENKKL